MSSLISFWVASILVVLAGCSARLTVPGYRDPPVGAFAEVCEVDELRNAPWNAVVTNLYIGQRLTVHGMYERDSIAYYLAGFQDASNSAVFFSAETGLLEREIFIANGMRVLPTLKRNKVRLGLNGCQR